jgi:hypothetical protein
MFSIDGGSGLISLAGKLIGAAQDQYLLTVLMSDETLPVVRTATCSVEIWVVHSARISGFFPSDYDYVFPHTSQQCCFAVSLMDRAPTGTVIGNLVSAFLGPVSFSIVDGNNNSMFAIDDQYGGISLAKTLIGTVQDQYLLTVAMSEPTLVDGIATATVAISISASYPPGTVFLTSASGGLGLQIMTAQGASYMVESTPDLSLPWTSSSSITGTGRFVTTIVPILPGQSQRFFRVRILTE